MDDDPNTLLVSVVNASTSGDFGKTSVEGILKMLQDPNNTLNWDSLVKKYYYADGGIVSLNQMIKPIGYR